jgi:hypothetical protein
MFCYFLHNLQANPSSQELPSGTPKLKSHEVAQEVSVMWNSMSRDAKAAATDGLLEQLVEARRDMDTKAKITPVHILNDVLATMAKIIREVCHVTFRTLLSI